MTETADGVHADELLRPQRVAAVRRLIGAGGTFPALQPLSDLAADLLAAPYAQVSLLTEEQLVAALTGLELADRTGPAEDSLCTVTLRRGTALVVEDAPADDAVRHLPPVTGGVVGAYLGVPLVDAEGNRLGALCCYDAKARTWTDADVSVLRRLAHAVVAELELQALRADLERSSERLELALSSAQVGSFDYTPATRRMHWDGRLIAMFGYDEQTFVPTLESFTTRVHPDDVERVMSALEQTLEAGSEYAAEYRVVLPGGTTKWLRARGRLVPDDAGEPHLLGAAIDTTAEQEAGSRMARVLESMGDGFYSLDPQWRFTYVNGQAERFLGRTRDQLLGRVVWEEYPEAAGDSPFWQHFQEAVRTGQPSTFEAHYPAPLDRWYELRAWPTTDGLSVYFRDVTGQKEVERQRASARARLSLLSRVTTALVDTLDVDEAMTSLVGLLVPEVATWAAVTLVGNEDELRHSVVRHADPERAADTQRYGELNLEVVNERSLTRTVARTGRPILRSRLEPEAVRPGHQAPEMHEVLSRLGLSTVVVVPLPGRQRVLGVLVLAGDAAHEPFTEDDLDTLTELGRRVGLALDNAQLYSRQRDASVVLQRSLLAGSLPQSGQLEVRARYLPAAAEAAAGGDWHDAILQPSGGTLLSIGDVMGHDVNATAAMGQVRTLLRGLAFDSQDSPAGVLRRVDAAMSGLRVDTLATAIVARVEDDADEHGDGRRSFRWSNAGHPPPVLVRANGKVEELASPADLLLGLDPRQPRTEHRVDLGPGDTVVLFTDGLVERRGRALEDGLADLQRTLSEHHDMPLDQLCDVVLHEHLSGEQDDDVALLAVRALPPG